MFSIFFISWFTIGVLNEKRCKKGGLDVFKPLVAAAVLGATSTQGRRLPITSIRPNTGSSLSNPYYVNLTKSNRGPPKGPVGTFTKLVDFNDPKKPDNKFDEEKNFREVAKEMSPFSDPFHKFTDFEDTQSNFDELQRKLK